MGDDILGTRMESIADKVHSLKCYSNDHSMFCLLLSYNVLMKPLHKPVEKA